jgi:hypothetical protein
MGKNNKNDRFDPSPWMKPINLTPIIILLLGGLIPIPAATAIADLAKGDDGIVCEQVLDKAIQEQKADPLVDVRYSGPADEKCGINRVIDEWP